MRVLLDLAAPRRCVGCARVVDADLCAACADEVTVIGPGRCARCGDPRASGPCGCADLAGFRRARSVVAFAPPSRELALALKRRGARSIAAGVGALLSDLVRGEGLAHDVVTFVPGGRSAVRLGFDHTALLAAVVARDLGVGAAPLLQRVADGPRQADVPLSERRPNVAGRFRSRPAHGDVLLVDDVYTTGATAEACSLALLGAGARSVDVVTWARTLRRTR